VSYRINDRVEKNPFFFKKKNNPPVFWVFFKKHVFFVFLKRNKIRFCSFFKENGKTLLHQAISLFSELHNNNLLYLLCHSNSRVKKCTPSLFLQSFGRFTPSGKAWQGCAQQTKKKHFHTNSAVSCQVYLHALLVQHL